MTTRKLAAGSALLVFAGCATPGPLHVYSLPNATAATIADAGAERAAATPSFVRAGETMTGFAYDPFTDHFFVRLAPGGTVRVVDRPARAIKREFQLPQLAAPAGGDLAIRPRDGHVFATLPGEAALVEFTRYGEFVGKVTLEKTSGAARGIAFDSAQNRLLVATDDAPMQLSLHAADGRLLGSLTLDRAIAPGGLAFDADLREIYAALPGHDAVGVFGEDGKLRREIPLRAAFFDVGPRAFLRMF